VRVLGFGTYDTARHPRVGIILDGLARCGDEVVEANVPLGFTTAERVAMLQRPWSAVRLVVRLAGKWWVVARRARRERPVDAVVVGYLGHFDVVLARVLFPRVTVVLDQLIFAADTARDRGAAGRVLAGSLRAVDSVALHCADIVVVDTEGHARMLPPSQQRKAVVVPVGASKEWFDAGARRTASDASRPLRVVFFGLFAPLQGAAVIGEALGMLATRADIEATIVGTGQDLAAARHRAAANSHVTWVDWVGPGALPDLVAGHDVCLGIFGTGPKAQRVVPNKVYQGAAAGCAIVTSASEPQRSAFPGAAELVAPGDAPALALALATLADDRELVATLGAAARRHAMANYTAATVVRDLRERLAARAGVRR
jgi:glycosyltransferase involved in cell wall biosynthesis